jgi:gas vesicle protein
MIHVDEKSSRIEREIEQDRRRIEDKIGAIQDKLSPGQLIDEALAYAKGHGGTEFASNLKSSAVSNPLPVALIGIGLAWLMAKPSSNGSAYEPASAREFDYPLAPIAGELRRSRSAVLEGDQRYSHFQDSSGKSFRALADESGRRAGHFIDDAGTTFRGFVDASGQQIDRIVDEAGSALDEASGWAERTWTSITDTVSGLGSTVSDGRRSVTQKASSSFEAAQQQSARFNDMIQTTFRDQPLVGGALAFAFGAAIGAALPRTDQEDALIGDTATKVKDSLKAEADKAIEAGSDIAAQALDTATDVASDVRDVARERIGEGFDKIADSITPNETAVSRP